MRKRNKKCKPIADRFWPKVDKNGPNGCWIWTAATDGNGYGNLGRGRGGDGCEKAHRVSYMLANGSIPDGMFVLHRCDNKLCVNPDHLFHGTHLDNMRDMTEKGRGRGNFHSGEAHGTCVLSSVDVATIRSMRASGSLLREIAWRFSISMAHVSAICRGKSRRAGMPIPVEWQADGLGHY